VRVNDPRVIEELRSRLPFGARPSRSKRVDCVISLRVGPQRRSSIRSFHILYVDGTAATRSLDLHEVVAAFSSAAQLAVAEHARKCLFVHAGVVEWNGAAILIPGRTYTGKSTLTLALVQAGARYYSDEYAVIDESGRVHPFPRPLSIRGPNGVEPHHLSSGTNALSAGWILLTSYRDGAHWRPRSMTPGEALLALLANTVQARRRSGTVLRILHRAVENAIALKGVRGEAKDVAAYFTRRSERRRYRRMGAESASPIATAPL
jgi:hypothetical protein